MMRRRNEAMFFHLYACCVPVKGYRRSIICDLQRASFLFIPNVLFEILTIHEKKPISAIKKAYPKNESKTIDKYFNHLISHEYGFFTNSPANFPKMNLDWDDPKIISNAILDFDESTPLTYMPAILEQLSSLLCEAIEFRFFNALDAATVRETLNQMEGSSIRSVYVQIGYHPTHSKSALQSVIRENPRIKRLLIHSTPGVNHTWKIMSNDQEIPLIMTSDKLETENCCGMVSPQFFSISVQSFAEFTNHNSCMNKKVSVDRLGYIKNCPSLKKAYGHIRTTKIADVVKRPAFTYMWSITKDHVLVCKDCEFRYICHDCRAYRLDNANLYSKPLKCKYDPYSAKWEN